MSLCDGEGFAANAAAPRRTLRGRKGKSISPAAIAAFAVAKLSPPR
jgi:hypothetical protein